METNIHVGISDLIFGQNNGGKLYLKQHKILNGKAVSSMKGHWEDFAYQFKDAIRNLFLCLEFLGEKNLP